MHANAKIEQAGLPPASQLTSCYGRADFAEVFSIDLPEAASHDAECMARHIFDHQPERIAALLKLRDLLVRPLGLKGAADLRGAGGDRINVFRVFERYPNEIVLGEDDVHLNFRVSALVQAPSDECLRRVFVTTLVFYNHLLGRAYIALIAPFHCMVVRGSLRQARRIEWPA
ncbi:DUF2867 domain-containing protein [Paraburkholderia silvatlantica]|uniref:Uncharacterized protein DUF2867 n=1 Tax=Paraburkholderia silvatlantica TaxID=321895 RepID=A0A2V4T2I0_9BURK|nr:DUF2867 domain-containing protein [Paraburkholderia silvatlantica]PYE13219.1 uncharacterized protein DUF2867 [Paraburkholderia silvatlantica]TDR04867.1 uncharacterized protein DUF2867 [Paraburkholderia silvatlantica]